jgi:hypothetical protein
MSKVAPWQAVASFDSASVFLSSLARALEGRDFPHLGQARWKVPVVRASALLPLPLRRKAYALASGREGIRPEQLGAVDLEQVAAWLTSRYSPQAYPGVLIGSSNGALAHLAAACGIPWLPQTLLVPVRRPNADPQDVRSAFDFGNRHATRLLAANPAVQLHHMHDANQDALTASQMAYFRVKWHRLPHAYRAFLHERLQPGAPVIVVNDQSSWPVTRCGDRHVFQTGAMGGMSPADYLSNPDAPTADETAPEAEWGLAEGLRDAVRESAPPDRPVLEIRYGHPQHPAAAVADTVRDWLRRRGEEGERLLVSSFIVHDPWRTIASASVPYWTFFPVRAAAADLADYLDRTTYDRIDIMLFSHGTRSRGLAEASTWQDLADHARQLGRLLAVDVEKFPDDFPVFVRYAQALRSLPPARHPHQPVPVSDALAGLARDRRLTVR